MSKENETKEVINSEIFKKGLRKINDNLSNFKEEISEHQNQFLKEKEEFEKNGRSEELANSLYHIKDQIEDIGDKINNESNKAIKEIDGYINYSSKEKTVIDKAHQNEKTKVGDEPKDPNLNEIDYEEELEYNKELEPIEEIKEKEFPKEKDEFINQKSKKHINKKFLVFIGLIILSLLGVIFIKNLPRNVKKESLEIANPENFRLVDIKEEEEIVLDEISDGNLENQGEVLEEFNTVSDNNFEDINSSYEYEIDQREMARERELEDINNAIIDTEGTGEETTQSQYTSKTGIGFLNNSKEISERKAQKEEAENIENMYRNKIKKQVSPYEIKQGSIIPAILITEINTDLQGTIIAQVSEDIYDSITGQHLLVKKGSKLYGRYESDIQNGIDRVLIVWDKLILTNGNYLDLYSMQGADRLGNAGLKDKKNNHTLSLIGNALLSSVLNVANKVAGSTTWKINDNVTVGLNGSSSTNDSNDNNSPMEEATAKILDRAVDRKPTLKIRRGFKFNIIVNEDLELEKLN